MNFVLLFQFGFGRSYPFSVFFGLYLFSIGLCSDGTQVEAQGPNPSPEVIDWAYSPADLMQLALFEDNLYKQYWSAPRNRPNIFQRSCSNFEVEWWIRDYQQSSLKMFQNITSESERHALISSHPFLTLRMMKRFRRLQYLLALEDGGNGDYAGAREKSFLHRLHSYSERFVLPNAAEVNNVMRSILQLKFVYDIDTQHLISGHIGGVDTGFGLRPEDVYELGLHAYSIKMYTESLDWLQSLYIVQMERPGWSSVITVLILKVVREHDDLIDRIPENRTLEIFHRFTHKVGSGQRLVSRKEEDEIQFRKTMHHHNLASYTRLCSGHDFQTEATRSKLYCWLDRSSDPAWILSPLKVEAYNWDPYIIEFHEIVGDQMAKFLRETIIVDMGKATAVTADDAGSLLSPVTTFRTSSSIQRKKKVVEALKTFNTKISRITKLVVSNSGVEGDELLQVASYAFGGSIGPHLDNVGYSKDPDTPSHISGRVSTFMVYLNNVRRGGYTAFPHLGLSVVPRKGSALFWHNLYRNGTADPRTLHAGCPVLLGQKWIATRWMNFLDNIHSRKCSLDPLE